MSVLEDVDSMKKGWKYCVFLIAFFLTIATVNAGTVEHGYQGSNVCRNPSTDTFIDFENGVDLTSITTQYPGIGFSVVGETNDWIYGDVTNTFYWNYPTYWCNGNFWATIEYLQQGSAGRIDFTNNVDYVSVLVSGYTDVVMEAYDASDILIDSAGPITDNRDTSTMDRLTVEHTGIKYVLIHDSGYVWVIDDLCAGAEGTGPIPAPEFPSAFLPATMIIGFLGAVFLIERTRE